MQSENFVSTKKLTSSWSLTGCCRNLNGIRELINRLLDYRIIHSVGSALTHKSVQGTFNAYMIDIGAYANLRKLEGRFTEIDITAPDAKERCRNAPVLDGATLVQFYRSAPERAEAALLLPAGEETSEAGQ